MIRLENLVKSFGDKKVLQGLTLDVPPGKTTVIMGRSGIGKSVTLKHIVGLLPPDAGTVIVDGEDIAHLPRARWRDVLKKFGVLFQSGALLNWMTVGENVALPLREHTRLPEDEIRAVVARKLALVELEGAQETMPSALSGGMRKRVGLARALVQDPEFILYDEPTSGLDPVTAETINRLIIALRDKLNVTSVVVTHDLEGAFRVGDTIAMMDEGKIVEVGTPDQIRQSGNPVVRRFVHPGGQP